MYKQRIRRLCDRLPEGAGTYIASYPNIFYYSGFTSEDARLFISRGGCCLLTDSRYTLQAREQAPHLEVLDKPTEPAALLRQTGTDKICFEDETIGYAEYERLRDSGAELIEAQRLISSQREIKETEEIKRLAAAEALGDAAFSYVLDRLHVGMSEAEAAAELEFFMKRQGASGTSFETIVASGKRSAMPHGTASGKIIEYGDFVTMDFGCVLDGYCSDMTRTVVMGRADERQREIYETVLSAQCSAIELLADGRSCREVDAAAREIISAAGYGEYFSHSLGHGVGVEIHEAPNLSLRSESVLAPGNAVTVEPGIYIDGFGGVRIEDLLVIMHEKVLNLTKSEKNLIII